MFGYIYHYIMGKMEPTDKRFTLLGNWKIVHFKLAKKYPVQHLLMEDCE